MAKRQKQGKADRLSEDRGLDVGIVRLRGGVVAAEDRDRRTQEVTPGRDGDALYYDDGRHTEQTEERKRRRRGRLSVIKP